MPLSTLTGPFLGAINATAFGSLEGEVGGATVSVNDCDAVVVGHLF
jgi:hypothetical protein